MNVTFRHFDRSIHALRITLGIIFVWFGLLKFGTNPVYDLVNATFPLLASGWGNVFLASFEVGIGVLLLLNAYPLIVHTLLVFHLMGTFGTFLTNPGIMSQPYFPMLTLAGEFVVKNLTLAAAGITVVFYEQMKRKMKLPAA